MEALICEAIGGLRLLQFHYSAGGSPGVRVVEPHQVGENLRGRPALSAWFLRGASDSREGEGWREYLVEFMSAGVVLGEAFPGPRPGYNPGSGRLFRRVRAAV